MQLTITPMDQVLARYGNQMGALGTGQAERALARALAHTGRKAKTQVVRALTAQTGLKRKVIVKAVRESRIGSPALTYELSSRGGNIRLKYFKARETRRGASAAPWNRRRVYQGTFQRAGWWKTGRVVKPNWNGQVFRRAAGGGFRVVRSGLYIPDEMVTGATADAWRRLLNTDLVPRVGHELARMLPR